MLFKYLMKFLAVWIFLVVLVFSGCSSESTTQHNGQLKKSPPAFKGSITKVDVSLVTEKTRQLYQLYCAQCHGEEGHGDGQLGSYHIFSHPPSPLPTTWCDCTGALGTGWHTSVWKVCSCVPGAPPPIDLWTHQV